MSQHKSNKVFSEINDFFSSQEKAVSKTMMVVNVLKIPGIKFEPKNNWPEQFSRQDILLTLLLMPLFAIKNVSGYTHSALYDYLLAGKDTLYRFKNESLISWRRITYKVNRRIIKRFKQSGTQDPETPRCLIVDDTDLRKTGKGIEHVSRIWSHVAHASLLGFKGLFLGYWDSKTFLGLDFSLHKEKGKNQKYPNGLSQKVNRKQYKKQRIDQSPGHQRETELHLDKISSAIAMIQRAVANKIGFEYVLMDSWFVCEKMILSVIETGAHLIGMCKMGTAKYSFNGQQRSAKQILDSLTTDKKMRWDKYLHLYVVETLVVYKDIPVKLFFCRNSKRGNWHLLVTTNTRLGIKKAYQTYAIRWSIEVFFKEAKQYFQLAKCQSRDFDAQIADTSICMIQYNIFSLAKRFSNYETLGGLFDEAKELVLELTVCKRLWGFFLEFIQLIALIVDVDPDELIERILVEDAENKFVKLVQLNAA
jgi:DDE superfamily endonuclease